jgi:tetratricopeptide (TPR) repeat protein
MAQAPIGAIISYWLRPSKERTHIHRIEIEHALYLANANQQQIKETLTEVLRRQTASLENISFSLDELRDAVVAGFTGVAEGLSIVDDTLHQGFYQLHVDALGTHARLDDVLSCLVDKQEFERELARRRSLEAAQRARYEASSVYSDAMTLAKRALNEGDLGKAGAMISEAIVLFGRACLHDEFALDAHFQLGYLAHIHQGDLSSAYEHYGKALGPVYSSHYVRTTRHLAHLDYLSGRHAKALARLHDVITHDDAIAGFITNLASVNDQPWPDCIQGLEDALARHKPLLERCAHLAAAYRQFDDKRRFSATERFKDSYPTIQEELRALRPDLRVYSDGARYAIRSGHSELALPWIKHCHDSQPTLNARRAFLLEAMADPDFRYA